MFRPALATACVFALAAPASAYNFMGQRWPDAKFPIAWEIGVNGADNITDGTDKTEVARAAQAWTDLPCSKVAFAAPNMNLSATATIEGSDSVNRVGWIETRTWSYGSGTLGVTTPKYYPSDNQIFDADIVFNGYNYQWTAATPARGPCRDCTDVFSIALHELGHFFGLAHSGVGNAIMYASYAGDAKQTLHQDDIDAACALYRQPAPNSGPEGSSCSSQSDCRDIAGAAKTCAKTSAMVANICTRTCTAANPSCPFGGYTCQDTGSGGKACLPPAAPTGDLCKACNNGSDCDTGICLVSESAGICSRTCRSASDCPVVNGQTLQCYQLGNSTACLPESFVCQNNCGAGCPSGQACVGGSCQFRAPAANEPCPNGVCGAGYSCAYIDVESNAACRKDCNPQVPASCPSGFACFGDGSAGSTDGACFPDDTPPENGRQGDTCVNSCAAGFWCKPFGSGMRLCVQDCNPNANNCANNLKCNRWSSGAPAGTQGGYCYGNDVPPPVTANACETCGGGVTCKSGQNLFCVSGAAGALCRTGCQVNEDCPGGSCETRAGVPGFAGVCRCGAPPKGDGEGCTSDGDCGEGLLCILDPSADNAAICRQPCLQENPVCVEGQECTKVGQAAFCLPPGGSTDGGGGGGGASSPCGSCASQDPAALALFAFGAALLRRRRGRA